MDKLPPVLVTKAEFRGRAILEFELDPLHSVVDPSADACRCEIFRICGFAGSLLRFARRKGAAGR